MILLPAIDILSGKPVRLIQGDYKQVSQVADSIVETAKTFEAAGAKWLHMVDLDGAKEGRPVNREHILQTVQTVNMQVEVGGGIRDAKTAKDYLDHGVARVIFGTAALSDPAMIRELTEEYKERIAVSLDAKEGRVMVAGWLEDGGMALDDAVALMEEAGVQTMIVTDISKDGMLAGPSFDLMEHLSKISNARFVASGGVSSLDDVRKLAAQNLYGAIAGKALYSGALPLKEALQSAHAGEETLC